MNKKYKKSYIKKCHELREGKQLTRESDKMEEIEKKNIASTNNRTYDCKVKKGNMGKYGDANDCSYNKQSDKGVSEESMKILRTIDDNLSDLRDMVGRIPGSTSLYEIVEELQGTSRDLREKVCSSNKMEEFNRNINRLQSVIGNGCQQFNHKNKSLLEVAEEMAQGVSNLLTVINKAIGSRGERLATYDSITNLQREITNVNGQFIRIKEKFDENYGSLLNKQNKFEKIMEVDFPTIMKDSFKPMKNNMETIAGKTVGLEKAVNEVKQVLIDKNLVLRQKFPVANTDEKILSDLEDYGHTIISQLSIAARWYARAKEDIDKLNEVRKQANDEYKKGYKDGVCKGNQEIKEKIRKASHLMFQRNEKAYRDLENR